MPRPQLPGSAAFGGGFLGSETTRLTASAHARELGQSFLRAGNLTQAKAWLARAEQLLQLPDKPPPPSAPSRKPSEAGLR